MVEGLEVRPAGRLKQALEALQPNYTPKPLPPQAPSPRPRDRPVDLQEVMAPGRGDLQGTAAVGLALHLLQIAGLVPGL